MRRRKTIPEDTLRRVRWWTSATTVYPLLMFVIEAVTQQMVDR
jgi:hypothetical protein